MRVLFCLAVLMMFACGGGEEAPSAPAETPSAAPSAPAPTTPPPTAPAPTTPPPTSAPPPAPAAVQPGTAKRDPGTLKESDLAAVPSGVLRGDTKRGSTLYTQYCSTCHGATGHGDGPLAASLNPKPANHTDASYMNTLTDQYLWVVITKGAAAVGKSPLMAPWGAVLTEQDTKDVLSYVRSLAGT